jgi:hypothetical protein
MTPIRLCFIGNSHSVAWKNAWQGAGAKLHAKYAAVFFASRGRVLQDLRFEGSEIVAGSDEMRRYFEYTSGGMSRIRCGDYDAFVLIGLDTFPNWLLRQLRAGTFAHSLLAPIEQLISEDCFRELTLARLRRNIEPFRPLRGITQAPILFAARPFPGEAMLDASGYAPFKGERGRAYGASLVASYRAAFDDAATEMQAGVLWQPDSTLARPGFTKAEFVTGAAQFLAGGARKEANDTHMNDAFGAVMIGEMLRKLPAAPAAVGTRA